MHFFRKTTDVVMTLDHLRRVATDGDTLNYIGIKCALGEKTIAFMSATGRTRGGELVRFVLPLFREQFLGGMPKHFDEFVADDLTFLFRVSDAAKIGKKAL